MSSTENKCIVNEKTEIIIEASSIDENKDTIHIPIPDPNPIPIPIDVDTKENIQEFFRACGLFYKGKSNVDINKAQQLYDGGLVTINCVDSDGWSALHHGCGEGNLNVVKWITGSCSDVNINLPTLEECTPLWVASFNGRRDVVQVYRIVYVVYIVYIYYIMWLYILTLYIFSVSISLYIYTPVAFDIIRS